MNTSKRLLSVLVCLVMVFSMFSGFAYATGSGEIDAQSTETTSVVNQTGAKPTTDVAAPTVDANAIVIDATATEGTAYTLSWNGTEYADMFVYGTNLFTSIETAQASSNVAAGATYLVKDNGTADGKVTITKSGNFYTEAYNTMPFVVGTAFDGSDWSLNENYTAKSVTLQGVEFDYDDAENTGVFNLYGFTVEYGNYTFDFNYCTGIIDVTIQNTYFLPTSSSAQNWFSMNTFAATAAAGSSNLLVKNFYVGGSAGRFTTEYLMNNVTFDGFYFPADVDMGGIPYIKQGSNGLASRIVFTNWNLQNEDMSIYFQGGNAKNWGNNPTDDTAISGAYSNKYFRAIDITNCTLNNSAFYSVGSGCIYSYMNATSMYTLKNNRFINTTGTDEKLFKNNSTTYANHMGLDMTGNYLKGYLPADSFASNVGNGNSAGITIKDNYLATCADTIGTDFYFDCTADTYDWHSEDWYLDADMSIKASSLAEGITVTNGELMQNGLNLTAVVPAGTGTDNIVLPENTTAAYDLTNGKAAITKVIDDVTYSVDFNLSIVELAAPLFSTAYTDPAGLIDASKAILITNAFASAADGSVQTSTWADDTEYAFVKGVNLFDTIEEASAYTLAEGIADAHYLILDISGSKGDSAPSQQFTMPGKYFTRNYNKNPYTKSDAALDPYGLQWASNVNTDAADSFVTADGISIKYLNLSRMAMAGDVEFYGFRITYTIEMNISSAGTRSQDSDMNVKFVNTYADIQGTYSLIYTDSVLNTAEVADQYNDSITFENLYFNPASAVGFLRSDCYPVRNITFDGVFMDEDNASLAAAYVHTYTSDYSFTIKNSNFRNVTMPLYLRGHYGKSTDTYLNRSIDISDNIFYNVSLLSAGYFIGAYTGYYNKFTFTNNTIYTVQDGVVLRNASHSGGDTHPDITVTVKENVLNGFASEFNIARWINASASEVGYNWVSPTRDDPSDGVTASGVTLTMTNSSTQKENGYEYSADYYIDSAKTMPASEFVKKFEFTMPGGGVYKDGATLDLYISSNGSAADLALKDANASIVGWKTADGSAADASAITKDAVGEGTEYVLTVGYPVNGTVYTMDFAVTALPNTLTGYAASTYDESNVATHPTEKTTLEDIAHFPSGFEDPAKLITAENAAFIDSDSGYGSTKYTISSGDYKVITWNGTQYIAVMNKTLFANVDNAYSTLTAAGIAQPEYLIAGPEWGVKHGAYYGSTTSNYTLRSPGKFFMPNYATAPYIKGDSKGNDWISNIGTGEGQFDPDNSIKAGYIHFDDTAKAGVYELYGYTIASNIYDARTTENTNSIDLRIYNSYFESTGAVYDSIIKYATENVLANNINKDSLTIKDSYIVVSEGRSILRNHSWQNITFDTVYADFTAQTFAATRYFHQVYNDTKLEIKNSFFTGNMTAKTYFEGYNNLADYNSEAIGEGTKSIILTDNIFKNYSFYGTTDFIIVKPQYYSEIVIKGNYIDNSGNTMNLFNHQNWTSNAGVDTTLDLTVEENTLIGFANAITTVDITRTLSDTSAVSHNYVSTDVALEGVALKAGDLTDVYYLDPERTKLSNVIYPMTFNYAGASYGTDADVALDVFVDEGYINLYDYIDGEQYNSIKVYSATDTDRIDPLDPAKIKVTGAIDLVVVYTSHDTTLEKKAWNITLNVAGGDVTVENNKAPGHASDKKEGYYDLSWNATVNGDIEAQFIPDGEIVDHRVGAIYAVSNSSGEEAEAKALLEAYVAELNAGTKETSELDAVLEGASYNTNVRVYTLEEKLAKWNSDTASYAYFFTVTVKPEKTRTVMMYAIYYNVEAGQYEITYSDFIEQTSPVAAAE